MGEGLASNTVLAAFQTAVTRIPGDFEVDLPDEFFDTDDFAESVTYTKFGGAPVVINVMFDDESVVRDPESGDITTSDPIVFCATKDVVGAGNKDQFIISGNTFYVRRVAPDGSGVTAIQLSRDQ